MKNNFGKFLRKNRKKLGYSLQDVSNDAGISKAHVWALEQGTTRNPSIQTIVGLACALEANPHALAALAIMDQPGVKARSIRPSRSKHS